MILLTVITLGPGSKPDFAVPKALLPCVYNRVSPENKT